MKAMILAAGLGKRLRPLTNTIPKPNLMVGGKSLIERNIESLIKCGFEEIVINVSYLKDDIKNHVKEKFPNRKIYFSEELTPLGTGGGVQQALHLLGNKPFILVNADICHSFELQNLNMDIEFTHIIGVKNPNHNVNGDFSLNGNTVYLKDSKNDFTWSGISVINPRIFEGMDKLSAPFSIWNSVIKKHILEGRVTGESSNKNWIDTGTIERLALANKVFKEEN